MSHKPNFVKFRPMVLGGDSITDRWMDGQTDGRRQLQYLFAFIKKRGDNHELNAGGLGK